MTHRAATATSFHTDAHATTRLSSSGLDARRGMGAQNGSAGFTTVNSTIQREGFYRESGSKIPTKSEC